METRLRIYTSFVSPATLGSFIHEGYLPVFIIRKISTSALIGKYSGTAVHLKEVAPSDELYRLKRDGKITIDEFKKRYAIELSEINIQDIITKLEILAKVSGAKGIILLGYGSDSTICHRTVLARILENTGLIESPIEEIKIIL